MALAWRGPFIFLLDRFDEARALGEASPRRAAAHVVAVGGHGEVAPVHTIEPVAPPRVRGGARAGGGGPGARGGAGGRGGGPGGGGPVPHVGPRPPRPAGP